MNKNTDDHNAHNIPLRALFLEDNPNDVELSLYALQKSGYRRTRLEHSGCSKRIVTHFQRHNLQQTFFRRWERRMHTI